MLSVILLNVILPSAVALLTVLLFCWSDFFENYYASINLLLLDIYGLDLLILQPHFFNFSFISGLGCFSILLKLMLRFLLAQIL
jgi:hypothetical protein